MNAAKGMVPAVNAWSPDYLEAQYQQYKQDPESITEDLRSFFQGFDLAQALSGYVPMAQSDQQAAAVACFQNAVDSLVQAYREHGHLAAHLDPFGREPSVPNVLSLAYHNLTEADLDKHCNLGNLPLSGQPTLRQIISRLETSYCRAIGAEITPVPDVQERDWLINRFEAVSDGTPLSNSMRINVLEQLLKSEIFEKFLGKRYQSEKRFSLEGSESLIPLLDAAIEQASEESIEEIVLGMAHRGRLNVLNNILGKSYEQIFTEFEDNWDEDFVDGGGDVKYHRGYSGSRQLSNGKSINLALSSNPSHLEAVDAVVQGRCRAKQRLRGDKQREHVIPMLIHGDAAIAGQGIVMEVLNLSQLKGYTTGGTVHVVVNNLIGFTTAPEDSRSTHYCTDVAKMLGAPVFHVNGEDPEAVVTVARLAVEYRQRFKKDVMIDLYCNRKFGHNEQDEQSFTNPILTRLVASKPSTLSTYVKKLLVEGVITESDVDLIRQRLDAALEKAQESARKSPYDPTIDPGSKKWVGLSKKYSFDPVDTTVNPEMIQEVCDGLARTPEGFNLNRKLKSLLKSRGSLLETGEISYADAESLAYGTLLLEGVPVRLSGQDSRRGTFSHRHAVLRDSESGEPYVPLNNMRDVGDLQTDTPPGSIAPDGRPRQAHFCVYDSPLSEASVLGFEYGYSLADPNMLVIWEAQFGDFVNGAQVIIDQFIASAELKWERWSGLTFLLPHGYEGAGAEHSSARMERFLQLCGNDNMQIVYPSTAAQTFHALRRQVKTPYRKPLIMMTPKSMLRVPTSHISELSQGQFHEIIDDHRFSQGEKPLDKSGVKTVILCCGKIYHELTARRDEIDRQDLAIVRIEQLYPFHAKLMDTIIESYPKNTKFVYVQEEPRNAGGYLHIADILLHQFGMQIGYIGRHSSSTPAIGSKSRHKVRQEQLLTEAVGPKPAVEKNTDTEHPKKNNQPISAA